MLQIMISDKFRSNCRINLLIYGLLGTHVVCLFASLTCLVLLLLHKCFKAGLIYGAALLLKDLCRDVKRETVGIIQLERICAGKLCLALSLHCLLHLI